MVRRSTTWRRWPPERPHLELYLRDLERRGYAPATISRRLSTVAGLFKYAVIDELVAANPTAAVTRPRVPWEGQRRTVLHPLEFAAVLSAARRHSDTAHALVALLGMLGLRVSEACNARVEDLRYAGGYELLRVLGKGARPAEIPLPIPVLRAVKAATEGRTHGPILLSAKGEALTRGAASRLLSRVVRAAGVTSPASPHTLRRTFCTAGPDQRRPAPGHAVRDAPRRRPNHHPLRHGPGQPRPARRPQRRRLPRRHGHRLNTRAGPVFWTAAGGDVTPFPDALAVIAVATMGRAVVTVMFRSASDVHGTNRSGTFPR